MHNNSNKSKGYEPVSSGPNMTGYYMGESPNLMGMQTGGSFGRPSTPGAALLARALQGQKDRSLLEDYEREEAKRQKKGGLFGSIGGIAGGLLGAALAPATGGASLALLSGLGTALGKRTGEGLGAGKSRGVDRSGTVFGQQSFRDVEEASRDYTRGMGERALVSGLKAAATAGLAPGGGMYGKVAGKLRPQDVLTASQTALPTASQAALKAGQEMGAEGAGLTFGRGDAYSGLRLTEAPKLSQVSSTGTDLSQRALDFNPSTAFSKNLDIGTVIPQDVPGAELATNVTLPEFDISLDDFSGMVMQPTEDAYQASLANAISLGEENALLDAARTAQGAQATAEEASRSAGSLIGYLQRQELGPLANFSLRRGSGSSMNPLLAEAVSPYFNLPMSPYESPSTASVGVGPLTVLGGSPSYGMENGGFIGMQTGGLTADEVLKRQGLLAGSKQLGLFQSFDPSGIQQSTQKIGQDLLGMTEGQGLSSLGGGFGAQAGSVSTMAKQGQESLEQQIQQEQRDYESSVLGTAADIVAGGGEFREYYGNFTEEQKERERAGAGLINREQGASFQPPTGFGYEGEQKLGLDNVMYTWSSATNQWIPNQAGGADLATMGAYSTGG